MNGATEPQVAYIRILAKRVRMKPSTLASWIRWRYGAPLERIDVAQAHDAIDRMQQWTTVPVEALEAAGEPAPRRMEGF